MYIFDVVVYILGIVVYVFDIVENKLHLHLIADFLAENNNFVGRKK